MSAQVRPSGFLVSDASFVRADPSSLSRQLKIPFGEAEPAEIAATPRRGWHLGGIEAPSEGCCGSTIPDLASGRLVVRMRGRFSSVVRGALRHDASLAGTRQRTKQESTRLGREALQDPSRRATPMRPSVPHTPHLPA